MLYMYTYMRCDDDHLYTTIHIRILMNIRVHKFIDNDDFVEK